MRDTAGDHHSSDHRTRDRADEREEFLQLGHWGVGDVDEIVILNRKALRQKIAIDLPQIEVVQDR